MCKRSSFLVNVVNCLRPIITKICEIPKFRDGRTDARGVCELVLVAMRKNLVERITTNKRGGVTVVSVSSTRKRKLFGNSDDRTPERRKRCKQTQPLKEQQTPPTPYPPEKKRKITVVDNVVTPPQRVQMQQPSVTVVGNVVTPPQRMQEPPDNVVTVVGTWAVSLTLSSS